MTHRIVIVGGGAGGLELATRLGRTLGKRGKARITLIDANLTHIWKPLLHEVAAGSLNSSADELNYVAQAKWNHFEFQMGRMSGLERERKCVHLAASFDEHGVELVPARTLSYDTLVIAVGSTTNDFGTKGAAEHCIFLDTREQAERFHRLLLSHYMRAHAAEGHQSTINMAIVGAGATGVELAAELHHAARELAAYGLNGIKPENVHITLIEAGPRVLPALPERISQPVHQTLKDLGVTVLTDAAVSEVTDEGLHTKDGNFVPATLKVWAAGIRAPSFLKDIDGLESNRINQLQVLPTLQTTRDENIFAFGDCAACPQPDSDRNVPPRAQAAHQQASLLAKSIARRLEGKDLPTYRYRDYGSLISLSSFSAVGNLMGNLTGNVMLEGWLARMFYVSLYRMHQIALYGVARTGLMMIGDKLSTSTVPRLKLH
ncbi:MULTISPECIES: NAD(P)/FAD-dependent oxidoreductase [Pseudomonadaceae]|jgi:NADH:ubiquinone reductase (H+-translocating)|uniref:NAD(P)/FAD-dependent oxidoreductase n=1 Tax=Pseudomonadaceae TaxID=135621 RepID=UPI0006182D43|nr:MULTISPECIES: NAD(P)/FAD-dependent oxidoreductase [Pseudomonadaceae]MAL35970.1 NAD(P)/FAD-dependent oxidoreductase [Pseudomonas sp.]MBU0947237.1 NAD(P)/FAD-dependent oxidoreductase [Gammaproteobacteria bacterium]KJJ62673.1 NADH dehydrogenase [Pseudomonas sp. 10B238]MBK3793491.1 FAD-dependent oxidoreductase [Stutzerimonas stutzeri]MBK3874981.1 FAD-dependent oxidoreductase [Stutzerimonas stutzeri]|tara:strand:- start:200 stop:1495 length:1296 start_codon:yes stop_codon:yes gene_type:complete